MTRGKRYWKQTFQFDVLGVFCFNTLMEFSAFALISLKKNSPAECNDEIYDKKNVNHHSLPRKMGC